MVAWLTLGKTRTHKVEYTEEEARQVLAGFAFAEQQLRWRSPRGVTSVVPTEKCQGIWAYRTYDCEPNDHPARLTGKDISLTAAVDSRIGGKAILGLAAVADDVSEQLKTATAKGYPTFWELTQKDLGKYPTTADSPALPLWNAWALLKGVFGADIAIPHKVLHRKRPEYFPLLDGNTVEAYEPQKAWVGIWQDLHKCQSQFDSLEEWFEELAASRSGENTPLKRLRMHDILLWAKLSSGQYQRLLDEGRQVLAGKPALRDETWEADQVRSPLRRGGGKASVRRREVKRGTRWAVEQLAAAKRAGMTEVEWYEDGGPPQELPT